MTRKPVRKESKESAIAKRVRLLENKVKRLTRLENKLAELERKIDHVYDLDDGPMNDEKLNKPTDNHPE